MRVVVCSELAPLDRLTIEERDPEPCGPGQVRIAVTAAGLSFVDGLIVQGLYQIKPRVPFVPGGEVAGTIAEVGADVATHQLGDRVFAAIGIGGGFASEVVVDAEKALPTPPSMSDGQAATFVQSYGTAWFALVERAHARAPQWLLVLGAGGGVGLAAVDVGRALGLRVIAAASSSAKRDVATSRGAEAVIDSLHDDVKARAREIASGDGVDLVYDAVGGAIGEQSLRALREDGQFLVVGFASGGIPRLPANQILLRNRRVVGVEWGGWAMRHPEENAAMLARVVAEIDAGHLAPVEPVAYQFDDVVIALADQLERRVTGKAALFL